MKMAIMRDITTNEIVMRFAPDLFERFTADAYAAEMRSAIKHFVSTDIECQVLINEMTKEAFKGIDLLAIVSEAIKSKVEESVKGKS